MAISSTIAAVRGALVDMITDLLPGVQVEYGTPPPDRQRREFVAINSTVTGTHDDAHLKAGRRTRDEDYDSTILIVVQTQPTTREAEARACELAAAVEDVLADTPKLGGVDGLIAAWPSRFELDVGYGAEGLPVCVLELTVTAKARLN